METDIRYYRRRACEELSAASRAITPEARERRLHLVNIYLEHLKALNAPSPFEDQQFSALLGKPAFNWTAAGAKGHRA